jgi:acylphosphatase
MKITRRIRISGQVQGVFFRESMRQQANQLGITGWVRNRNDGTVEAVVQGDAPSVEQLIEWSRRGPGRAQVERVTIEPVEDGIDYASFDIKPSA